ncbi:GvpL/GvpF family gas vesicle protein [Streptomyces sp. A7024]|uniref:GvpL/GvpF family gas vesicle protein n=1 Tax=Streptomyces coryli TaxID=1128680 RepID=A0A6G4U280_9ACTN|nr:GvpL/GvpF family gas vesicle protein [Streptomyces coryli]NGN66112.1 GvpL/GvpF family gas vesicle protein [Streptomyces coryli]
MTELWYVYAVTRADTPPPKDVPGIVGGEVRAVSDGALAAVVSQVPEEDFEGAALHAHLEDFRWLEATARAHQGVVDAAFAAGCALPLRLATVYRDEEGVRRMLHTSAAEFTRALDRLDGRLEWGVKVYLDEEEEAAARKDTTAAEPADGRSYLRARLAQRQTRDDAKTRSRAFSERLHETLRHRSEAQRVLRPQDQQLAAGPGRNVFNAAYLVPADDKAFDAELRGLADSAPGLRVEITGPWPPYSFADA